MVNGRGEPFQDLAYPSKTVLNQWVKGDGQNCFYQESRLKSDVFQGLGRHVQSFWEKNAVMQNWVIT